MNNLHTAPPRGITLDMVWIFAAVAFVALRVLLTPIPPNDLWWHMATGRLIVSSGSIPTVDSFSFTRAGEPFYNQSWLAQLLLYGLYQAGGLPLLIVVQAVVIAFTYWLLLRLCIERSGAVRLSAGVIMVVTMPASFDNWIVRPQSYALPLFVSYLYILSNWRLRGTRRLLWLLPPLAALWVNLHGSFVLGGALIGLTFVGEALRRLLADRQAERAWANRPVDSAEAVLQRPARPPRPPLSHLFFTGLAVGIAWLINPGGLAVLGYVRNLLSSSAVTQLVTEWAPPTTRDAGGMLFFLFLIVAIVALAYARRRPDPVDMLLAGAFLWLGLGAVRNNIWFCAVATPLIVVQFAAWRADEPAGEPERSIGLPAANAALIGMIALMLMLALPWFKPLLALPPALGALASPETPVAAVEFLQTRNDRPRRLFHEMGYGSYLIWALPEQKVFADPRIELYPLEQWQDYIRLGAGREVEMLLARYNIDGALLAKEQQRGLVATLRDNPAWEALYEDEQTIYFRKR